MGEKLGSLDVEALDERGWGIGGRSEEDMSGTRGVLETGPWGSSLRRKKRGLLENLLTRHDCDGNS